jgi:Rrf2 family protein
VIFSTTTEYAIRGLTEFAGRAPDGLMMLDELVAGTDLPNDFLRKVFQKLVKGGVLTSSRGRRGGFRLARPPAQITLMDVVEAIEGPHCLDGCVVGLGACNDAMPCGQHDLYKPIRQKLKDYLAATTLLDLANSLKTKQAWLQQIKMVEKGLAKR